MKICSHQPSLFPWIGYWNKVLNCDVIIMSCGVKFNHHNFQNRVQMLGSWLTLPVRKGSKDKPIKDVQLCDDAVAHVHARIRQELGGKKKPGHELILHIVDELDRLTDMHVWLMEYNLTAFEIVSEACGWGTKMVVDVDEPSPELNKTQRLVNRVTKSTGTPDVTYLGGGGMLEYFTPDDWPAHWKLQVQEQPADLDKNTLLQLIAQDATLSFASVQSACTWRVVNVGEEHTRNSAALG